MKIRLVSDLHLEFGDCDISNNDKIDVLILGGDIMIAEDIHDFDEDDPGIINLGKRQQSARLYRNFLRRMSDQFPHIIYIAGNHEFYHGKYPDAYDYLREECAKFSNIYFLEQDTKEIDDVLFVGGTLWTDMNKGDPITISDCGSMMNDYRTIRNTKNGYSKLRPEVTMRQHRETVKYIRSVLEANPNKTTVVVGHHAPSKLSLKPKYEKDFHLNGAYSSDLSEIMLEHPQVKLWTHGHTHDNFDYMIGSTRIVCNPRGYLHYDENPTFDPNLTIEL
jgi:Icc-related predicted phosphoesterase